MDIIKLGDISIKVIRKDIINIHLSVYPPDGAVRVSAPSSMDLDTIRVYVISKMNWIKNQQNKFLDQGRETKRDFLSRESHYFLGKRYLLKVIIRDAKPQVILKHSTIELYIRPNTSPDVRQHIINEWYRSELKKITPKLISKWEKIINVKSNGFKIRKMKTKWGSCNTKNKTILLNLELAKKPPECLEFIIVHELVHLIVRSHNHNFVNLMNHYMPKWRFYKDELNRLPFSYIDWNY